MVFNGFVLMIKAGYLITFYDIVMQCTLLILLGLLWKERLSVFICTVFTPDIFSITPTGIENIDAIYVTTCTMLYAMTVFFFKFIIW